MTNVTIEGGDGNATQGITDVRSKFMIVEYRRGEEQRIFARTYRHTLVQTGGDIRIAFKRVDLINCAAPMDGLVVPF